MLGEFPDRKRGNRVKTVTINLLNIKQEKSRKIIPDR